MDGTISVTQTTMPGHMNDAEVCAWCHEALSTAMVACLKVTRCRSVYMWDEEVKNDHEWVIQIKTSLESRDALVSWLTKNHPYDVPEIISWRAHAEPNYQSWIHNQTE